MEPPARPVGERLEPRARRRVDGDLLRQGLRDALEVARRQRERVDGHALPVGGVEHGAQARARLRLDGVERLFARVRRARGLSVERLKLCVLAVGEDDDGLAPLPLARELAQREAQPLPQQVAIYTAARARLQSLADRTGGRLHVINRLEDLGRLYAEVAAEMRTLYSIAYQSSNARPRDGSWRAINIEVTRAELIARARPGYYAR